MFKSLFLIPVAMMVGAFLTFLETEPGYQIIKK